MNDSGRPERILRVREVCERLSISRSTLYAMINNGEFPAGIKITVQRVGWPESVVDNWIRSRPSAIPNIKAA